MKKFSFRRFQALYIIFSIKNIFPFYERLKLGYYCTLADLFRYMFEQQHFVFKDSTGTYRVVNIDTFEKFNSRIDPGQRVKYRHLLKHSIYKTKP